MKKILAALLIAATLTACGQPLEHKGTTYPTVGFFNPGQKSPKMCYEVSIGNVIWSIITIETIVLPVYFIGWSIMNPVKEKDANGSCGID